MFTGRCQVPGVGFQEDARVVLQRIECARERLLPYGDADWFPDDVNDFLEMVLAELDEYYGRRKECAE